MGITDKQMKDLHGMTSDNMRADGDDEASEAAED
jgi:conjugal transfer/entry exclusion protein